MVWIGESTIINPEIAIINHIIKSGDIVTPLNGGVEKSFMQFTDEWEFIHDYYSKYRMTPSTDAFAQKFPDFEFYHTDAVMDHYINELHMWKARHVLQEVVMGAAAELKSDGPYKVITKMTQQLAQLGRDTKLVRDLDLVNNMDERVDNLKNRIDLRNSGRTILGVPTGIEALDEAYGGVQQGDFWVIAGWTGSLKSWLALYIAMNAWLAGYRVLYFSLEMSGLQIGYRFDTLLSGLEDAGFSNSSLTHATDILSIDRYKTWLGEIMHDKHPFVVVTNEDLDEINQNTVQAKIEQWKPDLCILDYHGLFDDARGTIGEVEKTKNLSKDFKRIAIRTGCPIIDITGVTMPQGSHGERPAELAELAWSKQLAYDSDLTLSLCKQGDMLQVVSKKVRRSADFSFFLNWDVDKGRVSEVKKKNPWIQDEDGDD